MGEAVPMCSDIELLQLLSICNVYSKFAYSLWNLKENNAT